MQHDCERSECEASDSRVEYQEREATTRMVSLIKHVDDGHFIVNIHALHNAHLIRAIFPSSLIVTPQLSDDRVQLHNNLASILRESSKEKKAKANEKRQATAAAKAKAKVQTTEKTQLPTSNKT